jgi:hypothetical protein
VRRRRKPGVSDDSGKDNGRRFVGVVHLGQPVARGRGRLAGGNVVEAAAELVLPPGPEDAFFFQTAEHGADVWDAQAGQVSSLRARDPPPCRRPGDDLSFPPVWRAEVFDAAGESSAGWVAEPIGRGLARWDALDQGQDGIFTDPCGG